MPKFKKKKKTTARATATATVKIDNNGGLVEKMLGSSVRTRKGLSTMMQQAAERLAGSKYLHKRTREILAERKAA